MIHFFVDFLDVIVVSEIALSPVYDWWIKHLKLYRNDCDVLLDGSELNASIISACQQLPSKQYPKIVGFEDRVLGHRLWFTTRVAAQNGVQILHTGT